MKTTKGNQVSRARRLRESQTPPEGVLWSSLRSRRLAGLKFRRQMPLDSFIVDFCCIETMLIVEVDSRYHEGRQELDRARDRRLEKLGYETLRITAGDIAINLDGVLSTIRRVAEKRCNNLKQQEST